MLDNLKDHVYDLLPVVGIFAMCAYQYKKAPISAILLMVGLVANLVGLLMPSSGLIDLYYSSSEPFMNRLTYGLLANGPFLVGDAFFIAAIFVGRSDRSFNQDLRLDHLVDSNATGPTFETKRPESH